MNESISRAAGAQLRAGDAAGADGGADPRRGPDPAPADDALRTPDPERVAASFGAAPLAEPLNPPVDTSGLRKPKLLVRPGLAVA